MDGRQTKSDQLTLSLCDSSAKKGNIYVEINVMGPQ
jgi:hypothetical protein